MLCWEALLRRDPQADDAFFYAVKTTGVYCRPTCVARLPNRRNVEFFLSWSDAERAGYRACRRCHPQQQCCHPQQQSSRSLIPEAMARACRLIEEADEPPSLRELASVTGFSSFHFQRLFKQTVGVTPKAYAIARRARRFAENLREDRTVTQAIYEAGFGSSSRCYAKATRHLGMTPSQYRKGGAGQYIRHAVVQCDLGWALVAATERGICAVELDDDPDRLRDRLVTRFPAAELGGDGRRIGGRRSRIYRMGGKRLDDTRPAGLRFRSTPRHSRHGLPATSMAGATNDSGRFDRHLCRNCPANWQADGSARRG